MQILEEPLTIEDLEELRHDEIVVYIPISIKELLDIRPIEFIGFIEKKILDETVEGGITDVVYRVSGHYEEGVVLKVICSVKDALCSN